jgi:hypothetical protein
MGIFKKMGEPNEYLQKKYLEKKMSDSLKEINVHKRTVFKKNIYRQTKNLFSKENIFEGNKSPTKELSSKLRCPYGYGSSDGYGWGTHYERCPDVPRNASCPGYACG